MKISDIKATTVTVPLEAPLRHAVGCHWGRFVRTKKLGGYPYDQDPLRPGWCPTIPNNRWADPNDARVPEIKL